MSKRKLSTFEEKLDKALEDLDSQDPFANAYEDLKAIAAAIEKAIAIGSARGKLTVRVVPGYQVNIGQQMKIVVGVPHHNFQDVLFRAYIPPQGYPIGLDLYAEEPIPCENKEALENKVLEFLSMKEIKMRLRQYQDLCV